MNNKKTDNYKNYKYVYTGYKDYCKNHNIKTTPTKNEENINHDHRFKFDFNNPNEHYHDYSFDFNNPNEHYHDYSFDLPLEKKTQPKQTYQKTQPTYQKVNTTTTAQPRTTTTINKTTTYQTNTKKNNSSGCGCVAFFFFFFFIFIFSGFFNAMEDIFDENNYDYEEDYYIEDTYQDALDDYITAIEEQNYFYIENRIYEGYNESVWRNQIDEITTSFPTITSMYSQVVGSYFLDVNELTALENDINSFLYNDYIYINEGYKTTIYFTINNQIIYKTITSCKINNYWYLIESK